MEVNRLDLDSLYRLLVDYQLLDIPVETYKQETAKAQRELLNRLNRDPVFANITSYLSAVDIVAACQFTTKKFTHRYLTEETIMKLLGQVFKIPYKKIDPVTLDFAFISKFFSKSFAKKHIVLPLFEEEDSVTVAIFGFDTKKLQPLIYDSINKQPKFVLSEKSQILGVINQYWHFDETIQKAKKQITDRSSEVSASNTPIRNLERLMNLKTDKELNDSDEQVVKTVEYIFKMALEMKASDIHVEPKREICLVRFRIDGMLHTITELPVILHPPILARVKITSGLNISEKRKPQDGRLKVDNGKGETEFRISTLPTAFGEKLVVRIFDTEMSLSEPTRLGFDDNEFAMFNSFLIRPNGVIFITGPTGSGKTTTLYSSLLSLYQESRNIVTIEDPIEMICPQFNQVNVHSKIGLDFATVLRAILRQDPNIIMVGETRDQETAQSVMQAAITGHLVFSTLHTNDSCSAITRLTELGVEPFLISSAVIGIIAQRLVRVICEHCKKPTQPTKEQQILLSSLFKSDESVTLYHGEGCTQCRNTGFKGRTGIFEILPLDDKLMTLVKSKADAHEIKKFAIAHGFKTLYDSGLIKVMNGTTTLNEVIRVAGINTFFG